jgi:hypothetical protein
MPGLPPDHPGADPLPKASVRGSGSGYAPAALPQWQGCLKVWAEVAAHRPCDEQDPISTGFLGAPQRGR